MDQKITYDGSLPLSPISYADSDSANNTEDCNSVTAFLILACGGPISWMSKGQSSVALSSTHAEYIALSELTRELTWLRQLLSEIGFCESGPSIVFQDNQQTIRLANNPEDHSRSKHIDVRHHHIREKVESKEIELHYIPTSEMVADLFTKPLGPIAFLRLRDQFMT
jgi:hypothetical protein